MNATTECDTLRKQPSLWTEPKTGKATLWADRSFTTELEAGCDCDCHRCEDCMSAYCKNVGGPDSCEREGE